MWHPSGCDLCLRPLVLSAGRAVVIGWLPAAESGFLDIDDEPAALYKAAFTTGRRVGATVDLEEDEVRKYLAPEACPSADDCVALMSEVCESVETSSSVEAMEIEAMETPPRAATPERSLSVTFCLGDAKKPKTDVEFQFDASPHNDMVLDALVDRQASLRGL